MAAISLCFKFPNTTRDSTTYVFVQDVWSHLYSLSFEPNPNWTREYPGQEEILDYLIDVAHKYQLYRHIRFNTAVEESRWDDESKVWKTKLTRLNTKDAEFGSDYIVTSKFLSLGRWTAEHTQLSRHQRTQ